MEKKINYQKILDELLAGLESEQKQTEFSQHAPKPSLLLHACCGPCSSYVLEYLSKYFQITVLYYNPNIYPQEEYERRLAELKKLYEVFPPALNTGVKVVECEYDPEQFYEAVGVRAEPELAQEPEKGERCRRCYKLRLERAAAYAVQNHFDYFCTSLSISPFKDAVKINELGVEIERSLLADSDAGKSSASTSTSSKWLFSDFKKKGGFKRSLELSKEYGMYRQDYCGCVYSMKNQKE